MLADHIQEYGRNDKNWVGKTLWGMAQKVTFVELEEREQGVWSAAAPCGKKRVFQSRYCLPCTECSSPQGGTNAAFRVSQGHFF